MDEDAGRKLKLSPWKKPTFVVLALAALTLLVLPVLSGCGSPARQARVSAPSPTPIPRPRVVEPAWRSIDRETLAARLGWGQVSRGDTTKRRIALTFDAGEDGGPAPAILDALKSAGLHCTFFLTGQFADKYPDLVKRIASDGHELGNHSYTHPKFTTLMPEQVSSEISRTEERVKLLTGLSTRPYFRFPYGAGSDALVKQINGMGYIGVLWTFDTLDSMGASSQTIIDRVAKYASPGAIVLMHCGFAEEAKALPLVIKELEGAGYQIVTLSEVLSP